MKIMPSGGVSPRNAKEWLDAGATVVGMGSNLVGNDISFPTGWSSDDCCCRCLDPVDTAKNETGSAEYAKALAEWTEKGSAVAAELFASLA
jgi:hypothetical protein